MLNNRTIRRQLPVNRLTARSDTSGDPGAFVSIPPGVPHAFASRQSAPARMLLICTPPGHEHYFADLDAILAREGVPDPDEIEALRARYDTTQVTPLVVRAA